VSRLGCSLPRAEDLLGVPRLQMGTGPKVLYEFGPFRVDPDKQALLREDKLVAITPKAFETLLVLIRHSREVVSKDELMKAVWPDAFVEEANLSQNIFVLRKALGETPEDRRYIVTLPGRGYRFVEEVRTVVQGVEDPVIEIRSEMVLEQTDGVPGETLNAFPSGQRHAVIWKYLLPIGAVLVLLVLAAFFYLQRRQPAALARKDTVLVGDFTNTTGDSVFDGTLRQWLSVQLEQSPFLRVTPDRQVQQTLLLMEQPTSARLTPEITRELCQRTGSGAIVDGSVARVGQRYILTLKATNCESGESLASAEAEASDKNHVLDALGEMASAIRNKLGESLSTLKKFDMPPEATTPSLEALKAFSSGVKVLSTTGDAAAIPFFKQAIELDPNFAFAYAWLGITYNDLGESSIAADYARKAYELRERSSGPEKYLISAHFYKQVTGNIESAEQNCKLWIQAYPRSDTPHDFLSGAIYPVIGQYEKGVEEANEAVRLNPHFPISYGLLMFNSIALNRLDEAKVTYEKALERKLNHPFLHLALYQIAFLQNDPAGMAQQTAWSANQPGAEDEMLALEADTAAYSGHLGKARESSRRAMDSAERSGENESAATYSAVASLREALFGNARVARRLAISAMRRSTGRDATYFAALSLAFAGDDVYAKALTDSLSKRFPEDTIIQFNYLPTLRARLAGNRGNTSAAIENLRAAEPYELGVSTDTYVWNGLYPIFVRGHAYLAARRGSEAAVEFQKILDHRGIVANDPIGALALLQIGRAYTLQGNTARARSAYQDFLTLWKDADPDIPVLVAAKSEYAKLQ